MKSSKFITLEGVDGAGKSTHIDFIKQYFEQKKIDYVVTREPGGTEIGENLREILLHQEMNIKTETLLMFAARAEHLDKLIIPNLKKGKTVLCDRFTDATIAYQSGAKGLNIEFINRLKEITHNNLIPDLTLLFDLPTKVSIERLNKTRILDKFEKENEDFHKRVRQSYLELAELDPSRFLVIDSSNSIKNIQDIILNQLNKTYK